LIATHDPVFAFYGRKIATAVVEIGETDWEKKISLFSNAPRITF